jgi:GNAT superfamily N-acetyltransferase
LEGYELTSAQIARDYVYVAEGYAKVLGFYSLIAYRRNPELDLLFVSDTSQGFGIGSALVMHVKQLALSLGIDAIRIVSHPPALNFYVHGCEDCWHFPTEWSDYLGTAGARSVLRMIMGRYGKLFITATTGH